MNMDIHGMYTLCKVTLFSYFCPFPHKTHWRALCTQLNAAFSSFSGIFFLSKNLQIFAVNIPRNNFLRKEALL